jgi:hypothetical protein
MAAALLALPVLSCMAYAQPAALEPWEQAVLKCAPGAVFDDCVKGLEAANIKLQRADRDGGGDVSFQLEASRVPVRVRTYRKAAGKIAMLDMMLAEEKGKGRKDLVAWFRKQIGSAGKQDRSGIAGGAAAGCGQPGWGVGWVAGKSSEPEVQIQLDSPESQSASDEAENFKPEDALVKREGNGVVHVCFLMPPKAPGQPYIDAPVLSPEVLKAFVASPRFHGKTKLK